MPDTPALRLLLQGYLSLDWPEDYGDDPWAAVDDFAASEPAAAKALPAEARAVLDENPTEEAVRQLVIGELASGYRPESDGLDYRNWLEQVAQRVAAPQ